MGGPHQQRRFHRPCVYRHYLGKREGQPYPQPLADRQGEVVCDGYRNRRDRHSGDSGAVMILAWLVIIPAAGGLIAWYSGRFGHSWPRWISLSALVITLALAVTMLAQYQGGFLAVKGPAGQGLWMAELDNEWIPRLGIRFHLAMDGLSLILVLLTLFLGIMAVASSWTEIQERIGFFYMNLLWVLAGITGVFLAMDLFIFYFFWEIMLVPMYFLIDLWGHENRHYAAVKFFIFTQLSGLLMLLSILGLYFIHGHATGRYTFDYTLLLGTPMK